MRYVKTYNEIETVKIFRQLLLNPVQQRVEIKSAFAIAKEAKHAKNTAKLECVLLFT